MTDFIIQSKELSGILHSVGVDVHNLRDIQTHLLSLLLPLEAGDLFKPLQDNLSRLDSVDAWIKEAVQTFTHNLIAQRQQAMEEQYLYVPTSLTYAEKYLRDLATYLSSYGDDKFPEDIKHGLWMRYGLAERGDDGIDGMPTHTPLQDVQASVGKWRSLLNRMDRAAGFNPSMHLRASAPYGVQNVVPMGNLTQARSAAHFSFSEDSVLDMLGRSSLDVVKTMKSGVEGIFKGPYEDL